MEILILFLYYRQKLILIFGNPIIPIIPISWLSDSDKKWDLFKLNESQNPLKHNLTVFIKKFLTFLHMRWRQLFSSVEYF